MSPGLCLKLVIFLPLALELSPVFCNSLAEIIELELPLDDLKLIESIRSGGGCESDALLLLDLFDHLFPLGLISSSHELGGMLVLSIGLDIVIFTLMRVRVPESFG